MKNKTLTKVLTGEGFLVEGKTKIMRNEETGDYKPVSMEEEMAGNWILVGYGELINGGVSIEWI